MKRRNFINISAMSAGAIIIGGVSSCTAVNEKKIEEEDDNKISINEIIAPITLEEIKGRIKKAQELMHEKDIKGLINWIKGHNVILSLRINLYQEIKVLFNNSLTKKIIYHETFFIYNIFYFTFCVCSSGNGRARPKTQ